LQKFEIQYSRRNFETAYSLEAGAVIRKNAKSEADKLKRLKEVAVLRSRGWDQVAIAECLGMSQSAVSKALNEALRYVPPLLCARNPVCNFDGAEKIASRLLRDEERKLKASLDKLAEFHKNWVAPDVHVDYAGRYEEPPEGLPEGSFDMSSWDDAVVAWGKTVAEPIFKVISRAHSIGICWGRQIRSVVNGIKELNPPKRGEKDAAIVAPMWGQRLTLYTQRGDTVFKNHVDLSSNQLAADLASALNSDDLDKYKYYMPVFDLIPVNEAVLRLKKPPSSMEGLHDYWRKEGLCGSEIDEETEDVVFPRTLRKIFEESIDVYNDVFGSNNKDAFANKMEAVIASVGASGHRAFSPTKDYGNIPWEWLEECVLGDIGGVFLPKPDKELPKGRDKAVVAWQCKQLSYYWTGVSEDHLAKCAKRARARRGGPPGVIVLAVGARRAKVTLECMKKNIINHLVVDTGHAEELRKLVDSELRAAQ
jgi:hypothetical protein